MSEENKVLVERYYQEAMSGLSAIEEIVSADLFDHHFPPNLPSGPEGVRQFFSSVLGSVFSDMSIDIYFMLADSDRVDCHFALQARHIGEFAGIPPKGNTVTVPAISTFGIEGRKLAEGWGLFDSGNLLAQMQA